MISGCVHKTRKPSKGKVNCKGCEITWNYEFEEGHDPDDGLKEAGFRMRNGQAIKCPTCNHKRK